MTRDEKVTFLIASKTELLFIHAYHAMPLHLAGDSIGFKYMVVGLRATMLLRATSRDTYIKRIGLIFKFYVVLYM